MKPIKVYLRYPWIFPDSPYYKYLIEYPPKGIKFLNIKGQRGAITNKRLLWFSNFLKRTIRGLMNSFKISIPNVHSCPKGDYDLIHCAHCLSKNEDKPWVADIEGAWQFYIGNKTKKSKEMVKNILMRKNCKKIMPWTQATANEIIKEFSEIKEKVEVVYPAVPLLKIKKIKHEGINLLFVSRYFYGKGGPEVLEVFNYLTKKYDEVNGFIVSIVPKDILNNYSKNKKIKFFDLMPQKDLFTKFYPKGDIFVYPGYSDSFGFSLVEAMVFGLPIVTVDGFARREIISSGENGFIIPRPKIFWEKGIPKITKKERGQLIQNLIKKISLLIENKKLREKIGRKAFELVSKGKFSIKERNKKLRKIYEEALS